MNENVYDCLNDLIKELDRLSKDHPQWKSSPLRKKCIAALNGSIPEQEDDFLPDFPKRSYGVTLKIVGRRRGTPSIIDED